MSRNKGPASVPTAPYTVTEGLFQLAATTEYYKIQNIDLKIIIYKIAK